MTKDVSARIAAARRAWSTFRGCWFQRRIPLKLRRTLYIASVRSFLLAGLVVAVLSEGDLVRLEGRQMRCARALMQGNARGHTT
eukprot:3492432-Heterocapsa_arctica.AAC.1